MIVSYQHTKDFKLILFDLGDGYIWAYILFYSQNQEQGQDGPIKCAQLFCQQVFSVVIIIKAKSAGLFQVLA